MAQLDRATVCGTVGRRFESSWARSFFIINLKNKGVLFLIKRFKISFWFFKFTKDFLNKKPRAVTFNDKENLERQRLWILLKISCPLLS